MDFPFQNVLLPLKAPLLTAALSTHSKCQGQRRMLSNECQNPLFIKCLCVFYALNKKPIQPRGGNKVKSWKGLPKGDALTSDL